MKIAFFGTPPFTVRFLQKLAEGGLTPALIITNPDRPQGRGMILQSPEPKVWGDAHNILVLQPEKIDAAFIESLGTDFDLFVVIAYGKILPKELIDLPQYGTINVHYSLLPKYRGATPVESAILNGDEVTGIAIQKMRYELDTGPIYVRTELDIAPTDTTEILRDKLNDQALAVLVPTIKSIEKGSIIPIEQSESQVSICKKIKKEDGEISLDDDPIVLDRKWRAYQPWPGLYFFKDGKRIKITKAHLEDGIFVIEEVVPENGKRMSFEVFNS